MKITLRSSGVGLGDMEVLLAVLDVVEKIAMQCLLHLVGNYYSLEAQGCSFNSAEVIITVQYKTILASIITLYCKLMVCHG